MLFDDEFFANLPDERNLAIIHLAQKVGPFFAQIATRGLSKQVAEDVLELLAVMQEFSDRYGLRLNLPNPELPPGTLIDPLRNLINEVVGKAQSELQKNQFLSIQQQVKSRFPKAYALEFTDGDLKRIQQLINELRDHISKSIDFDESHKQRVLRRLERLQGEIHKKMSDADRIFGLIGDAGVALGKFGKDAKPIVDRIKELAEIAWKAQARADELPSDAPFPALPDKTGDTGA